MRLGWVLAVVSLALSCGTSVPLIGPQPVSRSARLERIRAGSIDDERASRIEEHARLREIAETAHRVGNREDALKAATSLVQSATNWRAIARSGDDSEVQAQAENSLAPARAFALKLSKALDAPALTLDAIGDSPNSSQKTMYLRAARRKGWLSKRELRVALGLLGDSPLEQIALRSRVRADDDPDISVADLLAAGDAGFSFIESRWRKHIGTSESRDGLQELNDALLALDPLLLPARLAKLYWRDVGAGLLTLDRDIEFAITGRRAGGTPMVQLERATAAKPTSESLALGRVYQLYRSSLIGDALELLADARTQVLESDGAKAIAEQLHAILLLRVGDVAAYKRWARVARAAESMSATRRELSHSAAEEASVWTELVRDARVRAFVRGNELGSLWWRHRFLAADPEAPRSVRKRVIEAMRIRDPDGAAVAQYCLATSAQAADCEQIYDDVDELEEDEGLSNSAADVLRRIGKVRGLRPSLLWGLTGISKESLVSLQAPLAALDASVWASSSDYVALRLQVLIATGKAAEAQAFFAEAGALLGDEARILYRLGIADLTAGRGSADSVLTAVNRTYHRVQPRGGEPSAHIGWIADTMAGDGTVSAFARGRAYWNAGHAKRALLEWENLSEDDVGAEAPYFTTALAFAAQEAGNGTVLAKAKAQLAAAPHKTAFQTWLELRTIPEGAPSSTWAQVRSALWANDRVLYEYLAALGREKPSAEGLASIREILSGPGANLDRGDSWLEDAMA